VHHKVIFNMAQSYGAIDDLKAATPDTSAYGESDNDVTDAKENELVRVPQDMRSLKNENPPGIVVAERFPTRRSTIHRNAIIFSVAACFAISWFLLYKPMSVLEEYEYIVVGAGPAGLVAAVNIAKRLEHEAREMHTVPGKVLVLESGTRSQSAVQKQLNSMKGSGSTGRQQTKLRLKDKKSLLEMSTVNEFDIPLMWNGLSRIGSGVNGMLEYLSHHWPVDQTFLGRAVGGSGIHNAM